MPFADGQFDFGYVLGVLHYTPDPEAALRDITAKLKPGAPLLVYTYYALDNRPAWYRALWRASDASRRWISSLRPRPRYYLSQVIAAAIYYPLARFALLVERLGLNSDAMPLAAYRRRGFYSMRTDALDRLGSPIETRFTRAGLRDLMEGAGLERVRISEGQPYWCAVGFRQGQSL
jgi:SAM-dependent methyltransferase